MSKKIALLLALAIAVVVVAAALVVAAPKHSRLPVLTPSVQATVHPGWQTMSDATSSITFQYPAKISATYIDTNQWPPQVSATSGTLPCAEPITVGGQRLCRTMRSEGAAGSTYTTYEYTFQKDTKVITLIFTLRFVQCLNYDQPQQGQCVAEQKSFDVNALVGQIAETVRVGK